jgi:hypothetical protein
MGGGQTNKQKNGKQTNKQKKIKKDNNALLSRNNDGYESTTSFFIYFVVAFAVLPFFLRVPLQYL